MTFDDVSHWLRDRARHLWFGRKLRRARRGRDVAVQARLHRTGSPYWRHWRGALVRRDGRLRWRPFVRRWRAVDLDGAALGLVTTQFAVDRGELRLVHLVGVPRCDHLTVTPDRVVLVEELLRR